MTIDYPANLVLYSEKKKKRNMLENLSQDEVKSNKSERLGCRFCERKFNPDCISRHEKIC